ncbi:MAG: SH3 domain-containing protein [Pelagimonas sp.]|jgi:V8-like Glu-specific endopeptidase/SH3-like domain-containing protein|nr:SH3 domain-containing protein [Pelagimonas sp.]
MRRFTYVIAAALAALGVETSHAQELLGFDRSSFGRAVLNRTQSAGSGDIQLELSIGEYNNESITNYSDQSVFSKMGLAVGRLDILTDKGVFPCTAFIVDDKHILTNHHCVPGILENERAGASRIDSVMFVAGYRQQGIEENTRKYTVIPTPVESSKSLDYTVLEVLGDPSADYGTLRLAALDPLDGDPFWVIGHPMGEAQRISREKCRANRPALSGDRLLHTCDTLPGNSGSPVIDASTQMVVGLHHAGSSKDAVNFAIPMKKILDQSQVLSAALEGGAPAPRPAPAPTPAPAPEQTAAQDICDALYQEAKAYGQCFAYKAYLDRCDSHPFAIIAKGYVASECATPSPAPQPAPVTQGPRRPWCTSASLNATERAICNSDQLAALDAQLETAYRGQSGRSSAAQQGTWLRQTRNSCGSNESCIAEVVRQRISYLNGSPAPRVTSPAAGTKLVAGNYRLSDSHCYIVTASRPDLGQARDFVNQWFPGRKGIRIFLSQNGYYGITLQVVAKDESNWILSRLKSQNTIPGDSYCSSGRNFVQEVVSTSNFSSGIGSGSGGLTLQGQTMYVDNNDAGGLNLRSGPGTQYDDFAELAPGTQVTVTRWSGDWANIRSQTGQSGWVYGPLLTSRKPYVQNCWARVVRLSPISQYNRSTGAGFLNVRSKASTKGRILTEVYLNDTVRVIAQKNGWARIQCQSGQCQSPYRGDASAIGWSSAKYLSIQCN